MIYTCYYSSPIGKLLLASKHGELIGLWLEGQKYYLGSLNEETQLKETEKELVTTKMWLDRYFNGEKPNISELKLAPVGSKFRIKVWKILCEIPYGETTTYSAIAQKVAKQMNRETMSAQAVGGAVAHNPISIIIPCHRVIGTNGGLTGYAGGIDKKIKLLQLEKAKVALTF